MKWLKRWLTKSDSNEKATDEKATGKKTTEKKSFWAIYDELSRYNYWVSPLYYFPTYPFYYPLFPPYNFPSIDEDETDQEDIEKKRRTK